MLSLSAVLIVVSLSLTFITTKSEGSRSPLCGNHNDMQCTELGYGKDSVWDVVSHAQSCSEPEQLKAAESGAKLPKEAQR
eukprot:1795856-Rhodomonas_salina.3